MDFVGVSSGLSVRCDALDKDNNHVISSLYFGKVLGAARLLTGGCRAVVVDWPAVMVLFENGSLKVVYDVFDRDVIDRYGATNLISANGYYQNLAENVRWLDQKLGRDVEETDVDDQSISASVDESPVSAAVATYAVGASIYEVVKVRN